MFDFTARLANAADRLAALAERLTHRSPRPVLALAAIVKNEGPYLLEWVAWHRLQGITTFFIADNGSDDGTTALLDAMARAGLVIHFRFVPAPGVAPQLPAYRRIIRRYGHRAQWFAFFDADEFLRPLPGCPDFSAWLAGLPESVGAVGVNWACYGSSGRDAPGQGLIHERFTRRGEDGFHRHLIIKSVVRARDYRRTSGTPHDFLLEPGRALVDTTGRPFGDRQRKLGSSPERVWGAARLDHFLVKSYSEYRFKKAARGSATLNKLIRDDDFFRKNDANGQTDPTTPAEIASLTAEMAILRARLQGIVPAARDLDLQLDRIPSAVRPEEPKPRPLRPRA